MDGIHSRETIIIPEGSAKEGSAKDSDTYVKGSSGEDNVDTKDGGEEDGFDTEGSDGENDFNTEGSSGEGIFDTEGSGGQHGGKQHGFDKEGGSGEDNSDIYKGGKGSQILPVWVSLGTTHARRIWEPMGRTLSTPRVTIEQFGIGGDNIERMIWMHRTVLKRMFTKK